LASAAAFFTSASERKTSFGIVSPPILKWISERAVCAP
jgi:hypothetical protein